MEEPVRKKARKGTFRGLKNDGATQSKQNTLDSSVYLTYDILRIVFKYLNARDLANAAMVCRSWLEAANNERRTRGPCYFIEPYKKDGLLRRIKDIRIKPSAGFFFIPDNTPRNVEDHIQNLLPEQCEGIMLYSKGIVMDNKEMEYNPFPNIVCAFLPQIPNVRIKSFKVLECCNIRETAEYQEIISTIVNQKTKSNYETSTCFMLFCNYEGHTTAKKLASIVQKSKEIKIVSVWGGILEDIYTPYKTSKRVHQRMDEPNCIAVVITGSIQMWSTILEKKCNTKERVEERLKLFKDEVKLKKHSVGFMFACIARGIEMHQEANVESTIFKRLFPKVPLVGCFGSGEFGKTTIEVNEEKNNKKGHKRKKSWYNEFSTVFLILTYG